ncbi:hypothetical protein [Candidatus Poriferisodalis sp.]|uniref:hypothetical protein n=1 Tax=Candidatus Poriferisodalis sp. TaxID=3101277 RepID=UPI003B017E51
MFYAARRAHWAKRHTFALNTPGWVTVSIDNSPANTEPLDTYAVLLKDDNNKGTVIARNDNRSRRHTDARLADVFLQPGSYTIEATTKQPQTAGSYDITVEAVVSGLADSYTATVRTPKTITFRYWPPDAQIAVKTAAAEELKPTVTTRNGTATVTITPRLVHTHEDITVRVRHPITPERPLGPVTLTAECPPGNTPSVNNGVLCIANSIRQGTPRGSAHHVTPGTLNGVLASAGAAATAARAKCSTCGITANQLAAFMLSIGYHELRSGAAAPAPMFPGRSDIYVPTAKVRKKNLYNYVNDGANYIETKKSGTGVWDEPRRAFFHPGVGWWQIDDRGYWPRLNHGQRVDSGLGLNGTYDSEISDHDSGGEAVATGLARKYCKDGLTSLKSYLDNTWFACQRDNTPDRCYKTYQAIYVVHGSDSNDLRVTIAENTGEYSTDGGVSAHECRWHGAAEDRFGCFLFDTEHPEGRIDLLDKWGYDTRRSPLAAPFMAFTYDSKRRFAVFPGPVMTALKQPSHGTDRVFKTWTKTVPIGVDVREAGAGGWSSGKSDRLGTPKKTADDSVLEVEFCDDADWMLAVGTERQCRWVSVDSPAFARSLGYSPWPGVVP